MTAAILAGGLGTRLRPVVADRPKALAAVAGAPFLARLLDQLVEARLDTVVLCTGHLGDQIENEFRDSYRGLRLIYSREGAPLGTAGALREALPRLAGDPVLVLNGDSFCRVDLGGFRSFHRDTRAEISIVLTEVPDASRFGSVTVDTQGCILRFEEKQTMRGPGWINAGIYLLNHRVIEGIPAGAAVSLEREVFPAWIGSGLLGFCAEGPFLDIGTPESYAAAERFFA
jgi:NDP-sugar pyrophosphorylase family protein